jgi:hypothetical protein
MQKSWYKIFNYGTIAFVIVLAILLLIDMMRGTYDIIPRSYYYPLIVVVFIIFILRIIIRYYLTKATKKQS